MRSRDLDLVLLGLLVVWNEARMAHRRAALAEAVLNADPLTLEAMKKRMLDQGLNKVVSLLWGG